MITYKSDFLNRLQSRGFIHQCSDFAGLDEKAAKGELVAYIGFDATATSLHVGGLMQIMMLRHLQQSGNKPIVLMGGGTTKVGDPSGMVNNADWLDRLAYIPFLRDVGRHFSVNRMLSFDSVRLRLEREQPLSFLEFNYMILQAYDYLELSRRYGCNLQMGGSDQWGNILNGVELIRRIDEGEAYCLTSPLLTTSSGAKMGKTASGAVWLNADRLSPYDFWQYWRNTEDADIGRFLKLYTELPLDEIARLEALGGAEINEAKKVLATEVTALLHGRAAADEAAETARRTFEEGQLGAALPTVELPAAELSVGVPAFALFVRAGLAASNGEARKLIRGGGARLNDAAISDETLSIGLDQRNAEGVIKLSAGRKKHVVVKAAG
jgi:tyrosyl-tRNA synthetase